MNYNLYVQVSNGSFNLFDINVVNLEKVVNAYKKGLPSISINHKKIFFKHIYEIKIFTNEKNFSKEKFEEIVEQMEGSFGSKLALEEDILQQVGKNVTAEFLADEEFGYEKLSTEVLSKRSDEYVNLNRLNELKLIQQKNFDLSKLIRICEELNDNWKNNNYFTVGLFVRTIINHIPLIFGQFTTFDQLIAGYGSTSFKKTMRTLNDTLRSIADGYAHQIIQRKEPLPNEQQVDFKHSLDILLVEIIKVLH